MPAQVFVKEGIRMSEVITAAVDALNKKLDGEGFDGTAKFVIEVY